MNNPAQPLENGVANGERGRRRTGAAVIRVIAVLALAAATLAAPPATDPAGAAHVSFTGGELLGKPTANSITVNVVPSQNVTLRVQYGTSSGGPYPSTTSTVGAQANQGTEVTITGLSPNTRYYYRVQYNTGSGWENRPQGTFHTQRTPNSSFTFVMQSDSHIEDGPANNFTTYANAIGNMAADDPDFLIDVGDMFAVTGTNADVRSSYLNQRGWLEPLSANAAVFLAIGNHENEEGWWRSGPNPQIPIRSANARKEFFANPVPDGFYTGDTEDNSGLGVNGDGLRETYYAWEWGDALFVVLDPFWYTTGRPHSNGAGADPGSANANRWAWTLGFDQYNWLYRTLASSTAQYKFVFTHHLTGGDPTGYGRGGGSAVDDGFEWGGGGGGFAANRPGWAFGSIHSMLMDTNVSAVFHGHDHCYSTEQRNGIVYQEVPMPNAAGSSANFCGGSYASPIDNSGHVRVDVAPGNATVTYVRATDDVMTNGAEQGVYTINPSGIVNDPPVADAGADIVVTDYDDNGSQGATMDGSDSSDPDGSVVGYRWLDGYVQLATGVSPTIDLPVGVHEITLEVRDNDGTIDLDTVVVTVNEAPVADAGPDQLVVDSNDNGAEQVSLDGTGSNDPDGSVVGYLWSENGAQIATGPTPNVTLGLGTHTITLRVTDDDGGTDTDTVVVKVTSPPIMPDPAGGEVTVQARYGNSVTLDGFSGQVNVAFDEPGGGATCPVFTTTPPGGNNGCDLHPAWTATATGTGGPAQVVIADLAITGFNVDTDTVTVKITDPGGQLSFGCDGTVAVAYGADIDDGATATRMVPGPNATIDFSTPGPCPGNFDNTLADVAYGDPVYLTGWDNDGDRTLETRPVAKPFACPSEPAPFTDVPETSYAYADINCIYGLDITTGTSPSTYSPYDPVTREQMAAFLARLTRLQGTDIPGATHPFTDVPATSFAYDDIALIYRLGVTTGTSPSTYSPHDLVTREQMAAFIARLYSVLFGTPQSPVLAWVAPHPFTDVPASSFARDDVGRIYGLHITTGTSPSTYSPQDRVTREQMAAFITRLLRVLEGT